ncbi:MAG TPA: ribosome silencing factor, partial [Nannocystis sp.]
MTKTAPTRADLPPALQRALDLAVDAKAAAPVVLQLTEIAGYTDWALIVSGRSDRHVGGITEAIMAGLKDMGVVPTGTDGLEEHLWDLLDYEDFLVHVFYHPVRKHYDLESMWRDAPRVELGLPAEVMDTS